MLNIERISNIERLIDLERPWKQALQASSNDSLFLSHEWVCQWWNSFGEDKKLLVLFVKEGDKVVGIAPLMIEKYKVGKLVFKQISFIQNAHCYHLDFIVTRRANEVIELIFKYLKNEVKGWRRIYLIRIPSSSTNIEMIRDCCEKMYLYKHQYGGISPYIPISGDWESYCSKRSRNARRHINKTWKLLNQKGVVKFKIYKKSLDVDLAIKELFKIDNASWQGQEGSGMSVTPQLRQFYSGVIENAASKDRLVLAMMYLNNIPISYLLGVKYNSILCLLKMGYQPEFSDYAVGHHTNNYLLEYCFKELNVKKCEHVGTEFTRFKRRYTDVGQEFRTFIIYKKTFLKYAYIVLRNQIQSINLLKELKGRLIGNIQK